MPSRATGSSPTHAQAHEVGPISGSQAVDGHVVIIDAVSDLEASDSTQFWRAINSRVSLAIHRPLVVLNMTGVESFLDSLGLATLLNLHLRCRRHRMALRVVAPPSQYVRRVLEMTEYGTVLSVHDSIDDAIKNRPPQTHSRRLRANTDFLPTSGQASKTPQARSDTRLGQATAWPNSREEDVVAVGVQKKISNKVEQMKGKAKEAAGKALDDPTLEAEGQLDQVKGAVKQAGEKVKDAFKK